ncbi:MAG: type III pantothenate kinase [Pseudomonadales bacterium]|nr:type III pantothenate kinase [Pseudomonadales bacterium]
MILEIDAGNTAIKWRVVNKDSDVLVSAQRLFLDQLDEFKSQTGGLEIVDVRVASVAGDQVREELNDWIKKVWGLSPKIAYTQKSFAGLTVSYPDPLRLGVDRWLAMLAARKDSKQEFCVIDCGSAITIDWVAASGMHQGGYIVPGVKLMKKAVLGDTRQIQMTTCSPVSRTDWGTNTDEGVNFGIFRMVVNFLESVLGELKQSNQNTVIYLTGGDADSFQSALSGAADLQLEWRPELVLDGLEIALP